MKMVWKEQKLKTLEPPENAAIVESIFAQIITSIFISELIQVNGFQLCGRGRKSAESNRTEYLVLLKKNISYLHNFWCLKSFL